MTRYAVLWQQGGSYAASVDRGLLSTLWPSGGVTGGAVTAVANTMTVSVAPGVVAVPLQAGQGVALCRWDAAEVVTLAAAPGSGQSRIDVIVAQVRDNALDSGGNNDFVFTSVTGTPATTGSQVAPATPTNAYALAQVTVPGAVANLNTATITTVAGGLGGQMQGPAGRAHGTAATSMANNTNTTVTLGASDFLRGGMRLAGNGLVVPLSGLYLVTANVSWNSNNSATFSITIYRNGGQTVNGAGVAFTGNPQTISGGGVWNQNYTDHLVCAAGDTLTISGFQNAGGPINSGGFNPALNWLAAALLTP
jgi:hypothetical protein